MYLFTNRGNMGHYILNPLTVFPNDFKANSFRLALPVLDVLAKETHLRCHWWDTECGQDVVISITTHLVADYFVRISFHNTVREVSVLGNVLEDLEGTWGSCFDIVWLSSVVRPNELVSRGVTINNEFDVISFRGNEISQSLWFRLRECFSTWPVIST